MNASHPMLVTAAQLDEMIVTILLRAGASPANANCVASHLVKANLRGVDTHGVWQLPGYVSAIERKELLPQASPHLLRDTPVSALLSGSWGFGQVAALEATQQAIRKAQMSGISIISIVQSHHIGRLGEYAELAAQYGLMSSIWGSGFGEEKPVVVPYGGAKPLFGTNPIAIGMPASDGPPIIVDFATSATSGVKIIEALRKGVAVKPGWIVDKQGNATTDPSQITEEGGGQVAFGGHKGYALMLATEIIGRILSGADNFVEPPKGGYPFSHQGATMIFFRADLFQPLESYYAQTSDLRQRVKATLPATGFKEVSLPGDPEACTRAVREREGIPIPEDLWQTLTRLTGGTAS